MGFGLVKFSFIVVCVLVAFSTRKFALSRQDWAFLVMALLATLAADYFLVVSPNYPVGVTIFWGAHIFYALRFGGARAWRFFPLALPLPLLGLIIWGDILLAAALVYAGLFVLSYTTMFVAVKNKKYPSPNVFLLVAGMSLFVICDIFVAIFNMGGMGMINNAAVTEFAVDAIWLFYAPSQICLALSAMKFEGKLKTVAE